MSDQNKWGAYASHLGSYMKRWILRCPWGTLRLHNIRESDAGRDHHDHPFDFTSLILRGGYVEHRPGCGCDQHRDPSKGQFHGPCRFYGPGSIVRRKAEDFHRLELIDGPAWTLVLAGPYRREWGFMTSEGWVHFKTYHRSFYKGHQ